MKFAWAPLVFLLALSRADDDTTTTATTATTEEATSVWVTTTVGGSIKVYQSAYSQTFLIDYSTATVSAETGSVGMGSISGTVGSVRSYSQTTVSNAAAVYGAGALGAAALAMNLIL